MNKWFLFSAAVVSVGAFYLAVQSSPTSSLSVISNNQDIVVNTNKIHDKKTSSIAVLGYESAYGDLPHSLHGTLMQQALHQDESGALIVTPDLKRVFNYFLSTNQEEPIELIIKRISEYLDVYLDGHGLAQALEIMNGYIQMKQALQAFENDQGKLHSDLFPTGGNSYSLEQLAYLETMLQQRKDLREQYLPPNVAHTLYEREDAYDQFMLEKLKINGNDQLTDAEKRQALDILNAQQNPDWMSARTDASVPDVLREETQRIIEQGGTQEDIQALRVSMVGTEAASRYAQLDQERADWKQRVDTYLTERQHILDQSGVTLSDQNTQIEQLRASSFDSREQIRVRVYERQASR